MMATITSNLRLTKIDVDDNISPIAINENMEKIDEAFGNISTDYVVAQGVQEDWIYRRWNSGLAECWYSGTGNTGAWRWWSTKSDWLQYGSNILYATYPIKFTSIPKEFASAQLSAGNCWLDRGAGQTTTRSSPYWVTSQSDIAIPACQYTFQLYVVGRWK